MCTPSGTLSARRTSSSASPTARTTAPAAISGPRGGGGRRSSRSPPARLMPGSVPSLVVPDLVITEDREAVRHVVLNRPEKRNAFNEDLALAVGAALRA